MILKKLACAFILLTPFARPYAQVNLQTGSATFSLPMFSWQDDKSRLTSVVALSYSSGNGLKVDEAASNAGTGWSLVAGGSINRMQVGEPDDQLPYEGTTSTEMDISKYPAGYLYAPVPAYNGCPGTLNYYPMYGSKNIVYTQHNKVAADRELDRFSFQFNGKSGMFVLDPSKLVNGIGTAVSLGDTKMIITYKTNTGLPNIRTTIYSFSIQDVDGTVYKFEKYSTTQVLETTYSGKYNMDQSLDQPNLDKGGVYNQSSFPNAGYHNPYIINSWYLSEIDDVPTGRSVTFGYTQRHVDCLAGTGISYNKWHDYITLTHRRSIENPLDISSITFPDRHVVNFNYGAAQRADQNGEYPLQSVDILYNGRTLSEYQLNTSYFILNRYGTPVTAYQKSVARLCLRSVKKIGVDLKEDTQPYNFDYYLGSDNPDDFVPPPYFYAKDIWGFYNGNNSVTWSYGPGQVNYTVPLNSDVQHLGIDQLKGLCFLRAQTWVDDDINAPMAPALNPKAGYAQNGLLKQVIYPTGGTLSYNYAQNTGVMPNTTNTINVGGVSVSKTSSTDGGYSNGCPNPVTTSYNYLLDDNASSSLWGLEMPVNSVTSGSYYSPEDKYWSISFGGFLTGNFFGQCDYHYKYPGIMEHVNGSSVTALGQALEAISTVMGIMNIINDIQTINTLLTTGTAGFWAVVGLALDAITAVFEVGFTCAADNTKEGSTRVYYNCDQNSSSPLPAQFREVQVVENPATIGKTVQKFTSSDDYAVWWPKNPEFTARQRFAPWAYGLPKLTTVYDAGGNKVKETENIYDFGDYGQVMIDMFTGKGIYENQNPSNLPTALVSCNCLVGYQSDQRITGWRMPSQTAGDKGYDDPNSYFPADQYHIYGGVKVLSLGVDFYPMYSGHVELDTTKERVFSTTIPSQYAETVTSYQYNEGYYGVNFDVNTVTTTQSNGDQNIKTIKYPGDYNTGVLATMVQDNMVSVPVETSAFVAKAGTNSSAVLNEKVTEFIQLGNGDLKPSRVLEQRFVRPQPSTGNYQGPGSNISAYKIPQTFTYDGSGNLIGIADEGSRIVSNIYGYDDKFVTATVINADPMADRPAYTSFEDGGLGGWTLSGSYNTVATPTITGALAFSLSGNSLSATLNTARPYILSLWANAAVTVSGAGSPVKSVPTINGLTYYEYNIPQGTGSVSVSGNAVIDELRLYPQTARMNTTTYDPLIGKTSECDANNRITYYEYDNLGRLRFVKDENHDILTMEEYNNVSAAKQNGCPTVYYNHFTSETFSRSDCGTGYLGGDITYTVPAARYTSSLSQADADAQAETELLANGPGTANSTGSCSLIYYNAATSLTVATQTCDEGQVGGAVTYSVPANRYSSIISQADADAQATDELNANAQAYANNPLHAVCNVSTDPDYQADVATAATQCGTGPNGNGVAYGDRAILATDINPNSSTYGNTHWLDIGMDQGCPAGPPLPTITMTNQSTSPSGCTSGVSNSSTTISGTAGTVIQLGVTFSGYAALGSGHSIMTASINDGRAGNGGTPNTHSTSGQTSFSFYVSTTGSPYSITIPASGTVTVSTTANLENGTFNGSASLQIVSINGTAVNQSVTLCSGYSSGPY